MSMKIFIDGKEADTDERTNISISLGVASLTDMECARTGYSKTIVLPVTARNMEIMGDADQPAAAAMFNQNGHTAKVEKDGFTVIEGIPYLAACGNGNGGYYRLNIIGAGKEWAKYAAETPLRALPVEFANTISATGVEQSWTWDKPVRFLPVQRDRFDTENPSSNLFPPVKALTFEDYHPFLHIKTLTEKIFGEAGYGIESAFMSGEYFNSLYMSGNYPKKNVEAARALMDFRAGRFESAEAVADIYGRVYANPAQNLNSIGNIADTADPAEVKNGTKIEGVYTNGGYFCKDNTRVMFAPPAEVIVGFEYKLFYTTDYYMESRERLKGFSTVNLGDGVNRKMSIANRNTDRRGEIRANRNYMAIIFNYNPASTYQLRYDEVTNSNADPENILPSDVVTRTHATYSARTRSATISSSNPVRNPQMYEKKQGTSQYVPCESDWAMYDGYVTERGTKEIELTIRSSPERILPSKPKYFDMMSFGGAEAGMKFKIGSKTTVRPVFAEYPGEGTTVKFEHVAAHDMSCLDLINALKHMFNLWFYTDAVSRKVYIEPRDRFHLEQPVMDWTSKTDLAKPIVVRELGSDMPKNMTFQYATGDGAVTRWNNANRETLGKWAAVIASRFAKESESTYMNIFTPSLSIAGNFPDAPSAVLLQAGDREYSAVRSEDLNFPVKIVRYLGMRPLPQGQYWGWPSGAARYPFLAFHYKGSENSYSETPNPLSHEQGDTDTAIKNGFSLCFEDRDGTAGLHKYRDKNIRLLNESRRVELYLRLEPQDVEPLMSPNRLKKDFRAKYKLDIGGDTGFYRLEQVCDYNPAKPDSTKCVFIKEI